jgi:hypothetical protein
MDNLKLLMEGIIFFKKLNIFNIINHRWVMNDEACTYYDDIID